MSPQSILIGQIFIVFTTIILTTWYATQWVALQFDYDAYLGTPWFVLGSHNVYFPWQHFQWWYSFNAYAPHIFAKGGQISGAGGFLGIVFAIIGSVLRGRQNNKLNTLGLQDGQITFKVINLLKHLLLCLISDFHIKRVP